MPLNLNGVLYTDIESLEAAMGGLPEDQKVFIRNDFLGITNPVYSFSEIQQILQKQWGAPYVQGIVDMLGARNLDLAAQGITVNTAALLQSLGAIKELMNTGSLKTARSVVTQVRDSGAFTVYTDIFDKVIVDITDFLVTKGFE